MFSLFFQTAQGQTVNRKLYLKSGNLMDRTAPTGSTPINTSAFSKVGAIKDGIPMIFHNISGVIHVDPYNKLVGGGKIMWIRRPAQ